MTTNNSFLPDTYEPPASNSLYMKLKEGENNFRILSSPVLGWEYWIKNGDSKKPVRLTYTEENAKIAQQEAKKNPDPKDQKAKHFWAMVVWNLDTSRIEILQITQRGIQETLRTLSTKKGWGSPVMTYDISIDKSGSGTDTEYNVSPIPPSPLDPVIETEFRRIHVNLNALFYDADPFDESWNEPISADDFPTE